jgi:protein-disulfide isomerase
MNACQPPSIESSESKRSKATGLIDTITSISLTAAALVVIWTSVVSQRTAPAVSTARAIDLPVEPVSIRGAARLGSATARVAMIVLSDFECSYCSRFARNTFPTLKNDYVDKGKVLVIFKHLPLPMHRNAFTAAMGVECAGQQDKFWQMHDLLFKDEARLDEVGVLAGADTLALDRPRFTRCLAGETADLVKRDTEMASKLGIATTPTFLFGVVLPDERVKISRVMRGAAPVSEFHSTVTQLLK